RAAAHERMRARSVRVAAELAGICKAVRASDREGVVSFSAEWLSLREPHDVRARNPVVLNAVVGAFRGKQSLRITDLGCGTGSTLRTLSPRLLPQQEWRLIDYDPALLARAAQSAAALDLPIRPVTADLNRELEQMLLAPAHLLTPSALLDLVSEDWIERLVACAASLD